jgi:hypothetical protein
MQTSHGSLLPLAIESKYLLLITCTSTVRESYLKPNVGMSNKISNGLENYRKRYYGFCTEEISFPQCSCIMTRVMSLESWDTPIQTKQKRGSITVTPCYSNKFYTMNVTLHESPSSPSFVPFIFPTRLY